MKIFRSDQVRQIDEYTIRNEPVTSVDLMERAAGQLFEWYTGRFERSRRILIFAGPGNNGGDGLALARMLALNRYETAVFFVQFSDNTSDDWKVNRKRLEKETRMPFITIKETDEFPMTNPEDVIIDAVLGSGISRPAEGLAAGIIKMINDSGATVVSIDIPSGLFGEDNSQAGMDNTIRADHTLSFQFPKLSFMFPGSGNYAGKWDVLPIGLDFSTMSTPYNYLERKMITPLLKKRNKFDHKGVYGHGLLIGGSCGKMGAVVMGAKATLRTGIGLVTCHVPSGGNDIVQGALPEAMIIRDADEHFISGIGDTRHFDAAAIGPGMGIETASRKALHVFLKNCSKPLVIDADAINILSLNKDLIKLVPAGTILTPHPGEFERLAGKTSNSYERLQRQIEFSKNHNCLVVLKGAHTSVSAPDGNVWFNSTGNPGMATAGSGDVLTGMILSLLAQGYDPVNASIVGVYLHGLAGDMAADKSGYEALIATDIISEIGSVFCKLRED